MLSLYLSCPFLHPTPIDKIQRIPRKRYQIPLISIADVKFSIERCKMLKAVSYTVQIGVNTYRTGRKLIRCVTINSSEFRQIPEKFLFRAAEL